jgi:hypothetical protein
MGDVEVTATEQGAVEEKVVEKATETDDPKTYKYLAQAEPVLRDDPEILEAIKGQPFLSGILRKLVEQGKKLTTAEVAAQSSKAPEKAEDYEFPEFDVPDGFVEDAELETAMREAFKEAGLSNDAASLIYDAYNNYTALKFADQVKAYNELPEKADVTLKERWGEKYDANMGKVAMVLRRFFPKPFLDRGKQRGSWGDEPEFFEGMVEIAKVVSEGTLREGTVVPMSPDKDERVKLEEEYPSMKGMGKQSA